VLLEVYCLQWPPGLGAEGGYGKLVSVELLHKLRDEARYDGLQALTAAIAKDVEDARSFLGDHITAHAASHAKTGRQTTRDRI
jgi:riboflavin kinase / FMN adenylyltransferase